MATERDLRREVSHLRRVTPRTRRVARRFVRALAQLGDHLQSRGRYTDAEAPFLEAVNVSEEAFGADHLEVSAPLMCLAVCYRSLARYVEAGPLFQRALRIRERALGPDHADVADVYQNLGSLEHAAGNGMRGEPFARRAVRIRTRALGPHHPDVAADLTSLAALLDQQKKFRDAERLYRRALAIVERAHGPTHLSVAVNLNNLAAVRQALGRATEAEAMYRRALDISIAHLGDRHVQIGFSLNNLASLIAVDRPAEAAPLYRRAMTTFRRALGARHPNFGICLENYADVLRRLGQRKEAGRFSLRAERILARIEAVNDEAVGLTGTINPEHTPFQLIVRPSPIHRLGVFADEAIAPGRKVIEYTGERVSRYEGRRRWDPKRSYLFGLDNYWQLDGAIGGSGAEYINHSCDPNLKTRILRGHILYFSRRSIERGEELTVDYKYSDEVTRMACRCGAATCRGTMNVQRREARGSRAPRRRS
jgi:tetratricopeptide (TPR) repeat protein